MNNSGGGIPKCSLKDITSRLPRLSVVMRPIIASWLGLLHPGNPLCSDGVGLLSENAEEFPLQFVGNVYFTRLFNLTSRRMAIVQSHVSVVVLIRVVLRLK